MGLGGFVGAVGSAAIMDRAIGKGVGKGQAGYQRAMGALSAGKKEGLRYLEPYREAGTGAVSALSGLITGKTYDPETGEYIDISPEERADIFQESPGYQFRLKQGQMALEAGQAARGGLFSGRAGLEAMQYGQGMASSEYDSYLARLASLAGIGQSSAGQSANIAGNVASQIGQAEIGIGNLAMMGKIARGQQWADVATTAGSTFDNPAGGQGGGGGQMQGGGQQTGSQSPSPLSVLTMGAF